jgi:hypothetical protein
MNDEFFVVDVEFKNNDTKLIKCVIFPEEGKRGEISIQDKSEIEKKFQKLPWYAPTDGLIHFQNSVINGHFHVQNVKEYNIYKVSKENF